MNAIDENAIAGHVGWCEHGKPLDVIPVRMADEEVQYALATAAGTFHQFQAQLAQTRAGVNDKGFSLGLDFDTGGVAPGCAAQPWRQFPK